MLQQEVGNEGLHENDNGVSGSRFYLSRALFLNLCETAAR